MLQLLPTMLTHGAHALLSVLGLAAELLQSLHCQEAQAVAAQLPGAHQQLEALTRERDALFADAQRGLEMGEVLAVMSQRLEVSCSQGLLMQASPSWGRGCLTLAVQLASCVSSPGADMPSNRGLSPSCGGGCPTLAGQLLSCVCNQVHLTQLQPAVST